MRFWFSVNNWFVIKRGGKKIRCTLSLSLGGRVFSRVGAKIIFSGRSAGTIRIKSRDRTGTGHARRALIARDTFAPNWPTWGQLGSVLNGLMIRKVSFILLKTYFFCYLFRPSTCARRWNLPFRRNSGYVSRRIRVRNWDDGFSIWLDLFRNIRIAEKAIVSHYFLTRSLKRH